MDYIERKKKFTDDLSKRIQIAVEYMGHEFKKPNEVWDSYEEAGLLSVLDAVMKRAEVLTAGNEDEKVRFTKFLEQIGAIHQKVRQFARELDDSASTGNVDLDKVTPAHFDSLARIFERQHKAELRVVSPSLWL